MNEIEFGNFVVIPSKVVCIGRNYVEHIKELNNEIPSQVVIFNKPNSAISKELYYFTDNHRYEGELSFLIQDSEIVGVGFGLDLTDKKAQEFAKKKGLPWERAKAFNSSAVFSEFVEFNGDLETLHFKLYINGKLAQEGGYDLMIHKPNDIIKEVESFMKFADGDILMSGTPKGVGNYKRGDEFKATVYSRDKELLSAKWVAK
jgi:2-keto-4-pentenoate hydratase/2-oxohepta-3-ene-1,7-dioic acid hydratase in catechol pathway